MSPLAKFGLSGRGGGLRAGQARPHGLLLHSKQLCRLGSTKALS